MEGTSTPIVIIVAGLILALAVAGIIESVYMDWKMRRLMQARIEALEALRDAEVHR